MYCLMAFIWIVTLQDFVHRFESLNRIRGLSKSERVKIKTKKHGMILYPVRQNVKFYAFVYNQIIRSRMSLVEYPIQGTRATSKMFQMWP